MSFSIQTNVASLQSQENLRTNQLFQARTIERLTSGYRINNSGDDAAGLAVANKFRSDTAELTQGVRNANDGLSTLQIIDGGLNNISKMLDRLKTLATESASATFTGNRATLNTEYQSLLKEIDRQAENVGLGTGAVGGRFNKDLSVYVGGGGDKQSNSKVTIDLAGNSNRVDSLALSLSATNVSDGGATVMTNGRDLTASTLLMAGQTQAFTFNVNDGTGASSFTVTLDGGTGGKSGADLITDLNTALKNYGITASTSSATATSGYLQFSGNLAFTVSAAAASGGVAGMTTAGNGGVANNDSFYRLNSGGAFAAIAGGAEVETITNADGVVYSVSLANSTSMGTALTQLNTALKGSGIAAVLNSSSNNIEFQSSRTFSISSTSTVAAEGVFSSNGAQTLTNTPSAGSTTTSNAETAITKITSAVATLGLVQGTVGTAQNKLNYSINLAQSQISNFSSAEAQIRDADVAAEAANLTKAQVLQQASIAAMAQANSAPQAVLSLLRG